MTSCTPSRGVGNWVVIGLSVAYLASAAAPRAPGQVITEKTLVAWVSPANLTQAGGSVLTLEKPQGVFDAIVLGELAEARWMAGSNSFSRTFRDQQAWPREEAKGGDWVQVAIAYGDKQITIYRNGEQYAQYGAENLQGFGPDSFVVIGLRHLGAAAENRFFVGSIEDARVYDQALTAEQLRTLVPNQETEPSPIAWWDFEAGSSIDRMQTFTATTLVGEARIDAGRLQLSRPGAYLVATRETPETQSSQLDLTNANNAARALREHLLSDPFRPGYHFVIPEGRAMPFDPNGCIFWKGRYHLFYIFQDERGHNWGHVSSTDLFHWRHHPTGLVSGMFSGNCFINKDGVPTMCYHQVGQGNAMAVAVDDELNTWEKLPSNPITPQTEPGDPHHDKYRSWDPYGWLEGDTYYAIFGGKRPAVAKATELAGPWEYAGDLLANTVPGVALDEDVSCADFFRIGDKHMLLCISHDLGARYYLGEWRDEQFHPTFHEKMSWVDHSYFAPESLVDDRGRRIMWAWIFDAPGFQTRTNHGWSGTMGLPRVLELPADGQLRMRVPEEIERLRYNPREKSNFKVPADDEIVVEGVAGNSLEINLRLTAAEARQFGVKVCCSPDGKEQTRVYYDRDTGKLSIDTTQASLTDGPRSIEAGPLALAPDETLQLRVFVDKSVVEVFANDRQAVMRRIYPSRHDSLGVRVFAVGGAADVQQFRAWEMMPSNPY